MFKSKLASGDIGKKWHERFDKIAQWHSALTGYRVLERVPVSRALILCAMLVTLIAAGINFQIRNHQYQVWQDNPDQFYLGDTPLFSTTDASFFVGLARQLKETGDVRDYNKKRLYPTLQDEAATEEPQTALRDFPLLSVMIAGLSPDSSTASLLTTANALLPLLAFAMAVGVVLAFGAAGFWLEGAIAAVGAGLSYSFIVRTSIGRIDTDILNLGFFYAVLGLTILAARAPNIRKAILWSVLAALMLQLFFWWYEKAFMGWAFAIGLVWLSFMATRNWHRPLITGGIFILLSGLAFKGLGVSADSSYLNDVAVSGSLIYPNTFETITELRVVPFAQILTDITGAVWLGIVGVIGLFLFAVRYPVLAVIYGPATIFALANFLVGNRAVFYSAPMLWFGIGFVVLLLVRLAITYAPAAVQNIRYHKEAIISLTALAMMGAIVQFHPMSRYVPNPTFPKEMLRGFAAMDGQLPEGAVVATWWDYGYASMLFNRYNTLHDGGIQTSPATHYVARALLAPSQQETASLLTYLASEGLTGIEANSQSKDQLEAAFAAGPSREVPPIYLVLTEQMGRWMGSISELGLWDTEAGAPLPLKAMSEGATLYYLELTCGASQTASMNCNGNEIDFNQGTIAGQPLLHAITQARDGTVVAGQPYNEAAVTVLHLADIDGVGTRVLSMHERLADSSFHNLFHLGQIDDRYFELVYDDYPHMRILAVK